MSIYLRWSMALTKKEVVQKSYRIDKELEQSLEKLSKILNRSQNDLVNYALKLLFEDNKNWFFKDYIEEVAKELAYSSSENNVYIGNYEFIFQKGDPCHLIVKEMKNKECINMSSFDIYFGPGMVWEVKKCMINTLKNLYEKTPDFLDSYIYKHIKINDV